MICLPPPSQPDAYPQSVNPSSLLYTFNLWRPGETVHVRFMDGDPALWSRVAALVCGHEGWNACSSVQFCFCQVRPCGFANAPVRVTFAEGGSWSYLGRYGDFLPLAQATMNLDIRNLQMWANFRRIVLHEFGHALGLLHEQEHPQGLPWNIPAFEQWHRDRGHDVEKAKAFWFQRADPSCVKVGPYDAKAVMHYYAPGEWFTDGCPRGGGTEITTLECKHVERMFGAGPERWTETFLPVVAGA